MLTACSVVFLAPAGRATEPKPVYGLSLAYPVTMPVFREGDSLLFRREDEFIRLQLRIDKKGAFSDLVLTDVISDARRKEYTDFFKQFRFRPGKMQGKAVAQILPVTLYLFSDHRQPIVIVPITSEGRIDDPALYWQALELNGITLPHVCEFPSYHSTLRGSDSAVQLRYVLTSVDLDREGVPSRISLAKTNYPDFAGQILNAVNWGKYSPARVDSQAATSSCFLLVTFFPTLQYPSRPLVEGDSAGSSFSHERAAVRLLPDTVRYLSAPIPRLTTDWTYPLGATPGSWKNHGYFRYKIDDLGTAYLVSGGNGSAAAWQFGQSLETVMRFYPAVDKRGNTVSFEGVVRVTPVGKSNVRVEFLWLQ